MEQRLERLEMLFMEQEQTLDSLSEQVYVQQKEIAQLRLELHHLKERLKGLNTSIIASPAEETPPPHY
ncbi:MAG: SlyX family protein [Thiofilum sp.]|uniref:SlyX family protein n=1 Tax=Thiofilum sp. TaxID=2212733 RepID=UPI0025F3CD19|nr:SlyX family protein [Thiofilum sp.]MBK8453718.1 SlyX family protein [Thiofilum sp.]